MGIIFITNIGGLCCNGNILFQRIFKILIQILKTISKHVTWDHLNSGMNEVKIRKFNFLISIICGINSKPQLKLFHFTNTRAVQI